MITHEELKRQFFSSTDYKVSTSELDLVPGSPIGYWISEKIRRCFVKFPPLSASCDARHGMSTSDNARFLRYWFEVSYSSIGFSFKSRTAAADSGLKWFPYNKGGAFRRWYGNNEYIVNWQFDGKEIKEISNLKYPYLKGNLDFVLGGQKYFFQPGITWSSLSIGSPSMRLFEDGFIFDAKGQSLFPYDENSRLNILGYLNSTVASKFLEVLSPTVDFNSGQISLLPVAKVEELKVSYIIRR